MTAADTQFPHGSDARTERQSSRPGLAAWFWQEVGRQTWFPWLAVWFGGGAAGYFALATEPEGFSVVVPLTMAALGLLMGRRRPWLWLPALFLLFLCAGFGLAQWRAHALAAPVLLRELGPLTLSGQVLISETRASGYRLTIAPSHGLGRDQVHLERVRITVRGGVRPRAGDQVAVRAVLMPPSPPLRPGAFDFSRLAWFKQLGAVGYAVGQVEITSPASGVQLSARIEHIREAISERIRSALPDVSGAVTVALLTGDRGGIPEPVMQDMRDAGLAHLLAISGLHVGLFAGCLFALVRLVLAALPGVALRYPTKKIAAITALLGAVVYLLLTGGTVPTQRAVIMVGFAVMAVLLDRSAISMRVLACAALLVLALAPESLLSPSFQMSFAAVAALIAVYEWATPRMADWRRDGGLGRRIAIYLISVGLTTIVAGIATAPFAAFHFHRLAGFGLVANLLAVPLTAFAIMPLGLAALLLMPFGLEVLALGPMGKAIDGMLLVAHGVSDWPGAIHMVPQFSTWLVGLLTLCGLWFCLWRGPLRFFGPVVATGLIASLWLVAPTDQVEIVVSETGTRYAVRDRDGRVAVMPRRTANRTVETWLTAWGIDPLLQTDRLSELFQCDQLGCVYSQASARPVSFSGDLGALVDDCRESRVVIASFPTRWHCRQPDLVIDHFSLWRNGAYLLRLSADGFEVDTVAAHQGQRPWSRSWQRQHYRGDLFSSWGVN